MVNPPSESVVCLRATLAVTAKPRTFAENHEGFVDVSHFDGSQGSEKRTDEGNFIIGERNHA